MRKEAPRGIAEGDPRLEWVTLVKTLVAQLGIFVARDEDGKEYLPHVECYVDDFRETDHEELLNINVHNLTSSSCHPKVFVKEFCYFLMSCHQHCLGVNLLVQR